MCRITERNFNDLPLKNCFISVDPNNRILSNNLVLILKYVTNTVTWTSGFVKSTDQIFIVISYRNLIRPRFYFFDRIIISTTNFIVYFINYFGFFSFFDIDVRNDLFSLRNYFINFFTVWTFSICVLFSLLIISTFFSRSRY